jgi:dimethylhistidine N-methyltransferase
MNNFMEDVIHGLSQSPKQLHCKYFYDERGSELFDQICALDEYYLTRTEVSIMETHISEMAFQLDSQIMLVEPGSGSSTKTRILLDALHDPVAYVPVDISSDHLHKTAERLTKAYPQLEVLPVVADFTQSFELPETSRPYSHAALFFPGSTIGNFTPEQAVQLMSKLTNILGPEGGLLIGIDLQKEAHILEAAYNDSKNITAEFNLNLLHRINHELNANFDVDQFEHRAVYNQNQGRIEIFLDSLQDQSVTLGTREFSFCKGEPILTEYSHKYTTAQFQKMAQRAGFTHRITWTDDDHQFAIMHLVFDG